MIFDKDQMVVVGGIIEAKVLELMMNQIAPPPPPDGANDLSPHRLFLKLSILLGVASIALAILFMCGAFKGVFSSARKVAVSPRRSVPVPISPPDSVVSEGDKAAEPPVRTTTKGRGRLCRLKVVCDEDSAAIETDICLENVETIAHLIELLSMECAEKGIEPTILMDMVMEFRVGGDGCPFQRVTASSGVRQLQMSTMLLLRPQRAKRKPASPDGRQHAGAAAGKGKGKCDYVSLSEELCPLESEMGGSDDDNDNFTTIGEKPFYLSGYYRRKLASEARVEDMKSSLMQMLDIKDTKERTDADEFEKLEKQRAPTRFNRLYPLTADETEWRAATARDEEDAEAPISDEEAPLDYTARNSPAKTAPRKGAGGKSNFLGR